jgi:hypothetical protein
MSRLGWMHGGVLVVAMLALPLMVNGQTVAVAGGAPDYHVRYTATFSPDQLSFGKVGAYDTVALADGTYTRDVGQPMLPVATIRIALPGDMAVSAVRVIDTQTIALPGEYDLLPTQPPRHVGGPAQQGETLRRDPAAYASATPFPAEPVRFVEQADLAGQSFALIELRPLQYLAAQKKLVLHTTLELELTGAGGYVCGDYLPPCATPEKAGDYAARVAGLVVNPADVHVRPAANGALGERGVGPGDYDYVIICQSAWVSAFQPLADWKTKKGVPATIVTTDWIYNQGGYSGNNVDKMRAFFADAYNNWGARYYLLGGDTDTIPYHSRYGLGDNIPNDTYYGDFDGDWVCEAHVGRASVASAGAIATFISKVLTYEQTPPLMDYAKTATFVGFDLYSYGSGEGENCKKAIKSSYLPASWTYRYEYDSESTNHYTTTISLLNQGNNLMNHVDHGDTDYMGTGCTNHGPGLSGADMSALSNGTRQGILYTIGCWCNNYPDNAISEAFVRNANGGGLAFVGNSRYGWYMPNTSDDYSLRFDRYFFRSLFTQGFYHLGACFSDHKNASYNGDQYYQYIFTELTLLGDPELPVWTENPTALTIEHADTLYADQTTPFTVHVLENGLAAAGATVCLWKPGEVYRVGDTDAAGYVSWDVTPDTVGTLYVTATRHNNLPAQGAAQVSEGQDQTVYATNYSIVRGIWLSGGLPEMRASDDARLNVQTAIFTGANEPPVWITLTTNAPTATPSALKFKLEAQVSTASLIMQTIKLYNYRTASFETISARSATPTDLVLELPISGDVTRFIDPISFEMQAQLTWKSAGAFAAGRWSAGIDQAVWIVTP